MPLWRRYITGMGWEQKQIEWERNRQLGRMGTYTGQAGNAEGLQEHARSREPSTPSAPATPENVSRDMGRLIGLYAASIVGGIECQAGFFSTHWIVAAVIVCVVGYIAAVIVNKMCQPIFSRGGGFLLFVGRGFIFLGMLGYVVGFMIFLAMLMHMR
jgi:hypothetical protein